MGQSHASRGLDDAGGKVKFVLREFFRGTLLL